MKRNILKDTLLLTFIQLFLDGIGLLLNSFMTKHLGAEAIGIFTLTNSFFQLASMIAGGNVFLCASRFISEELGKPSRNPRKVLAYCLETSLVLSLTVSLLIILFAPWCGRQFLHDSGLTSPIRLMAISLPLVTLVSCFKGYFNACCKTGICAAADAIDFLVHAILTMGMIYFFPPKTNAGICFMMAFCTISCELITLIFLLCCLPFCQTETTGKVSLSLKKYIFSAVPVMAGSALTSFLSAANDALVPITLKQSGNSNAEALSQFGIFEAIVIPVLFFPSTIFVSLSGILVTETARENAAHHHARITCIAEKAVQKTILFAVFVTEIFILFGNEIGEWLGGGVAAGKTIAFIAPVVPFIYLEIILESIIKGIGSQAFSSLNYLAEYVVRISCVLIFIPILGFYGIVLSYYASNIFGNVSRIIHVIKKTGMEFSFVKFLGIPLFSAVLSGEFMIMIFHVLHIPPETNLFSMICFILLCCPVYLMIQKELFSLSPTPEKSRLH